MIYWKVIELTGKELCLIWDEEYLANFIKVMEAEKKEFIVIEINEQEVYRTNG